MNEDTKRFTFSLDSNYVEFAAEVFRLLSDSTRVRLILVLREGEKSVNDLAELVHKTPHSGIPAPGKTAVGQNRESPPGRQQSLL